MRSPVASTIAQKTLVCMNNLGKVLLLVGVGTAGALAVRALSRTSSSPSPALGKKPSAKVDGDDASADYSTGGGLSGGDYATYASDTDPGTVQDLFRGDSVTGATRGYLGALSGAVTGGTYAAVDASASRPVLDWEDPDTGETPNIGFMEDESKPEDMSTLRGASKDTSFFGTLRAGSEGLVGLLAGRGNPRVRTRRRGRPDRGR